VADTDVWCYCNCTSLAILSSAEAEKKRKYLQACQDRRATFTPLCMSIDGMMGREAKWDKDYSSVMGWVCTRLSFAILRATLLCICGSHTK